MPDDTGRTDRSDWHWVRMLLPFLKPFRGDIASASAALIGDALLTALRPWPLKVVIDRVINGKQTRVPLIGAWVNAPNQNPMTVLYLACGATLLIALGTGLLTYYYTRTMGYVGQRFVVDLRRYLFAHIQRLSLRVHDTHRTGDLLTRLTSDIGSLRMMVARSSLLFLSNAFLLFAMLGMMLWLNWQFTLVALSVSPFLFWAVWSHTRSIKSSSRVARQSDGLLASLAQETLSSIRIVQGLAQESRIDEDFTKQSERGLKARIRTVTYQARMAPVVDCLAATGLALVMWYGATRVMAGTLTTGDVIVFFAYVTNFYSPMRAMSRQSFAFTKAAVAGERIGEILEVNASVSRNKSARSATGIRGDIEFRDISFAYNQEHTVLSDINLHIRGGEHVAVIGSTGAGKSTLASLILRLYEPTKGRVLIDGRDSDLYDLDSLRDQIGLVLQEPMLFSGTIAENIAFASPDATRGEIVRAARTADADSFITQLQHGYDTDVAEQGTTLSGGQRQRIAIARAVLRDAPILLLDEPTSSLDYESEKTVLNALEAASATRTTVLITHRLSAVRLVDRILVMHSGRIVEEGTHEQLLAQHGRYAQLWSIGQGSGPQSTQTDEPH